MAPKPARPPKVCVFCRSTERVNKEHLFPKWMHPHLPRTAEHARLKTESGTTGTPHHRQGDVSTIVFRVVCEKCNGGWMSELEARAKPLLIPAMNARPLTLTKDHQRTLATWIAVKMTVGEFANFPGKLISPIDATFLKEHSQPPNTWDIWLAHCLPPARWRTRHFTLSRRLRLRSGASSSDEVVLQFGSIGINQLFMHGRHRRSDVVSLPPLPFPFVRIWPIDKETSWPPPIWISPMWAELCAHTLKFWNGTANSLRVPPPYPEFLLGVGGPINDKRR